MAGCRHRLLNVRRASLDAIRDGFKEHMKVFRFQLGAFTTAELLYILRGKFSMSSTELLDCFLFPDDAAALGSDSPYFLRELLADEGPNTGLTETQRLDLLTHCTALPALPCVSHVGGSRPRSC